MGKILVIDHHIEWNIEGILGTCVRKKKLFVVVLNFTTLAIPNFCHLSIHFLTFDPKDFWLDHAILARLIRKMTVEVYFLDFDCPQP